MILFNDTRPFFNDENNIVGLDVKRDTAAPCMMFDDNIILWL